MYPNLSYLLHDLFGTGRDNAFSIIQMFGLMLGVTFFVGAYILYIELKRKESEGLISGYDVEKIIGKGVNWKDVVLNAFFGFFLGFKLPGILTDFDHFKNDAAAYIFSGQGNWLIGFLAFIGFGGYYYWLGTKEKLDKPKKLKTHIKPHERIGDLTIIAAIFGILGSRLFSILENLDSFWQDPIGQIFSGSGLTIYGGLILAFTANYIYAKRHHIPPIHVMDGIAPGLMLGYGVGRLGCQISGDGDWGIINELPKPSWFVFPDWMWAYDYPHNVLREGAAIVDCLDKYCTRLVPPVFPTPMYEVIASVIIFAILWSLRKRIKFTGFMFFFYLILMSIERFFVEYIRVNPRYKFIGADYSQAQIISIFVFITGIVGLVYWYKKSKVPDISVA